MPKNYSKIVRDNIPEIISRDGRHANTRLLREEELLTELTKKLQEEVHEFAENHDMDELADTLANFAHREAVICSAIPFDFLRNRSSFDRKLPCQ